jgi:hypothetical protein
MWWDEVPYMIWGVDDAVPAGPIAGDPNWLDTLIPPIGGSDWVGNGAADALNWLSVDDYLATQNDPNQTETLMDLVIDRAEQGDPDPWSRDALEHDIGSRRPDGSEQSTLGHILNDLDFALDSLDNIFLSPTGILEAAAGVIAGVGFAAYHLADGVIDAVDGFVSDFASGFGDFLSDFTSDFGSFMSDFGSGLGDFFGSVGDAIGGFFEALGDFFSDD